MKLKDRILFIIGGIAGLLIMIFTGLNSPYGLNALQLFIGEFWFGICIIMAIWYKGDDDNKK